jgi:hypothetical protein
MTKVMRELKKHYVIQYITFGGRVETGDGWRRRGTVLCLLPEKSGTICGSVAEFIAGGNSP